MAKVGKRVQARADADTRPGAIFALALVAAAPAIALFVVGPLLDPNPLLRWPTWRAMELYGTPFFAAAALVFYFRVPMPVRERGAARAGRTLAIATGGLWVLFAASWFFLLRRYV
ncbi:MAG: hypothetical protein ACYDCK_05085 [Thermoplasmatota archaeon]